LYYGREKVKIFVGFKLSRMNLPVYKIIMITRRNFISSVGLTALAAAALSPAAKVFGQKRQSNDLFAIPAKSYSDPVLTFTSAHFTPFVNTNFKIRQSAESRIESLKLLNVKEIQRKGNLERGVQGDSFSLMFASTRGAKLTESPVEFTHPSLGVFSLILLPVSAEPNRYEAIINHLSR
jgi:hypothetical protein